VVEELKQDHETMLEEAQRQHEETHELIEKKDAEIAALKV
jgi:N-dimethylarginine dimethylaminohydrolase